MAVAIQIPGIPPLFNPSTQLLIAAGSVLFADAIGSLQVSRPWGIYDTSGNKVLDPDSVGRFGFRNNWKVSDYPVEQGAFDTYNKVSTPYASTITMIKGGTLTDRTAFLDALDVVADSLDTFSIVTPEKTYTSATIERYDLERRRESGANLIIVNIHVSEVRITPAVQYSSTRSGAQIDSSVPASARTNATTSTGLPNPTAVKTPSSAQVSNLGQVSSITTTIDVGIIQ